MPQKIFSYTVIFEPAEEGGFTVTVPALPGCITEGDNFEEAREMAKEAIQCYLEGLAKDKEPIPIESGMKQEKISVPMEIEAAKWVKSLS